MSEPTVKLKLITKDDVCCLACGGAMPFRKEKELNSYICQHCGHLMILKAPEWKPRERTEYEKKWIWDNPSHPSVVKGKQIQAEVIRNMWG